MTLAFLLTSLVVIVTPGAGALYVVATGLARGSRASVVASVGLSGVFMAMTLVVFTLYGVFAAAVRNRVISRPRVVTWMRRTFAATYVALAARMALVAR